MHSPINKLMYLFCLTTPCTVAASSPRNTTTASQDPSSSTKRTGWCQPDSIPWIFLRDTATDTAEASFPPTSVIAVRCLRNPRVTHWLVCSDNATWVDYGGLQVANECQPHDTSPPFANMVESSDAAQRPATRSWTETHRVTSVMLCVALVVFLTVFSFGIKMVFDKRDAKARSRRWRQTHNGCSDRHRMGIATVSGHLDLVVNRPASTVPVHIVVTTFINGTSIPSLPLPPNGVCVSDVVPSYDEVLAHEDPPPSYADVARQMGIH